LMGSPTTIEPCQTQIDMTCNQALFYDAFMERWIVYEDFDNKVVHKAYNVLY
jgi:hypothetical protein